MTDKRNWQIGVFVTKEEYARLKEAAGDVPLSTYCRKILIGEREVKEPKGKSKFSNLPSLG